MQCIQIARRAVRTKAPYFWAALSRTVFLEVPAAECEPVRPGGFSTLGMTDQNVCYYSAAFVSGLPTDELAGALVHELLHFIRQDVKRFEALCKADPSQHHNANLASDMANNDDLVAGGWKLPGRPLTKAEYAAQAQVENIFWLPSSIGMPEGQPAQVYLEELRKKQSQKKQGNKGQGQPGKGGPGNGQCGSCAGNAHDIEKKLGLDKPQPGDGDGAGQGQPGKGSGEAAQGDPLGVGEAEAERIRAQVAREVASHVAQKGRGSVPGGLARWAEEKIKPPKVRWQDKLQRLVRRTLMRASGATDMGFSKPSRRQAGLGYGPGRPLMPSFHGHKPNVAVVVDTSGSMSGAQLAQALGEVDGILRAVGGDVTFCAIDAGTDGLLKVRSAKEAASKLKGGGGTDMKPALKLLMESRTPPSVIIVLTDGMIGDPGPEPKGAKVIWALIGSTYTNDVKRFGEVVLVDREPTP
jgi:predicted metal-dependent peptidase